MPTDNAVKPATPLPWKVGNAPHNSDVIYGTRGTVAEAFAADIGRQDALYIVEACNAYPRLLAERAECIEVLHEAAAECDYFSESYDHAEKTRDTIRALLSRIGTNGGGK